MAVFKDKEKTKDGRQWYFKVYYTDISGNKKVYKSKKFSTKKEALEEEAKFVINRSNIQTNNITFEELFWEYYNYIKPRLKERTTAINYSRLKLHVFPYFKNKKISDITVKDIINWQEIMNKKQYSHEYKTAIFTNFKSVMNYGVKFHGLSTNPLVIAGGFKNPQKIKEELRYWTYEQFEKFIEQVDDFVYKAFYTTLFFTGLRCGEAQALKWEDFKFNQLRINKTLTTKIKGCFYKLTSPKTKKSNRIIELPNRVIKILNELKEFYMKYENFDEDWFIFGGIRPLPETTIRRKKKEACIKASVPEIRIHDFRHSFASLLINKGVRIQIISEMLGHEKVSTTTDIYGHLYPSQQHIAVDILNKL